MAAASHHLSLRVPLDVYRRLGKAAGQRSGESRSSYVVRLLDEGLRMEAHPGVVFRPGPAGRRPGLVAGPDIWEVARVLREQEDGEAGLQSAARLTGLTLDQVRTADNYYRAFQDEIDGHLQRVDDEASAAASRR